MPSIQNIIIDFNFTLLSGRIYKSIALALNFNKLQMYASNVHQIQETAQNSLTLQAI